MTPRLRPFVILAIAFVASSCSQAPTATCFQPSVRPTRVLTPDRYAVVVSPTAEGAWVRGESQQRPTVLVLADGVSIKLDSRTRLLSKCFGSPCSVYLGYRPHTHTADWVFGVVHRRGSGAGIEGAAVWHFGSDNVVMSSGLRLRAGPTNATFTDDELRKLGTLASVSLDDQGVIQQITHGGCA